MTRHVDHLKCRDILKGSGFRTLGMAQAGIEQEDIGKIEVLGSAPYSSCGVQQV